MAPGMAGGQEAFLEEVAGELRAKELVGLPATSEAGDLPCTECELAHDWSKKSSCPMERDESMG